MKVKSENEVAQSCPTLSDSMDCSPPGSSTHGILQARVLEWGAVLVEDITNLAAHNFLLKLDETPKSFLHKAPRSIAKRRSIRLGAFQLTLPGSKFIQGKLGMLQSMGSQRVRHN